MIVPIFLCFVVGTGNGYDVPRELKYGYDQEWTTDSADSVRTYDFTQSYSLLTHFYPIGWSPDGKFAYVSLFDDHGDAYGYINCQVIVVDVGRNEIVWSFSPPDTENPSDTPFWKIWRTNRSEIEKNLKRCAIVQDSFSYQNFPIFDGRDTITGSIDTSWVSDAASQYGFECIDSLRYVIHSARTGDRILYEIGDYASIGLELPGYLRNPRGRQIVIPVIATYWGWEGPPNTTSMLLLGYSLP
jgi:hypothetical protein